MKKSAIVLQKPSGTIAVRIDINARQRKLYNGLLYNAKQQIRADLNKEKESLTDLLFIGKNKDKSIVIVTLKNIMVNLLKKMEQEENNQQLFYFLDNLKYQIGGIVNLLEEETDNNEDATYKEKLQDILQQIAEFSLLDKKRITFRVPMAELKKSLTETEEDRNNVTYIKQMEEMMVKTAEYNILTKDKIILDKFVLIPRIKKVLDDKTTLTCIEYEIPTMVNESLIRSDGIYASIDLVIIRGLKSKYAIILYELCRDYQKMAIPKMELNKFREIFCVENKYPYMNDLERRVLEPAIAEINNNPSINFMVGYEPVKTGRSYTHMKFLVTEKRQEIKKHTAEDGPLNNLLAMLPEKEREKGEIVISKVLAGKIKIKKPETSELAEYIAWQIDYANNYKNVKSYQAILKAALKDGYAQGPTKKTSPKKVTIVKMPNKGQEKEGESSKEQYLKFLAQDKKVIAKYIQKAQQDNPEFNLKKSEIGAGLALKHLAAHTWAEDHKKD